MSKREGKKLFVPIVPGIHNPLTSKIMDEELIKRGEADYQAYMLLRTIIEEEEVGTDVMLKYPELYEKWQEIKKARERSNDYFMKAAAGRLRDGSLAPRPEDQ